MTKDEMKDKTKRVARFSRNYTKKFREVADILNGTLDAIPEVTPVPTPVEILDALTLKSTSSVPDNFSDKTSTEAAALLGITEQQLTDLVAGKYLRVHFIGEDDKAPKLLLVNTDGNGEYIYLGYYSPNAAYFASITSSEGVWGYEAEEV